MNLVLSQPVVIHHWVSADMCVCACAHASEWACLHV